MLRISKITMTGPTVPDATVSFYEGANILAGESDTGKSLILHCIDYILGADKMAKSVPETEVYSQLLVEFNNTANEVLTLRRHFSGGDIEVYKSSISDVSGDGIKVVARRRGRSEAADVTSVLFPFAGIPEAVLRKNGQGQTQRLTVRTLMPTFLVDEISVIAEQSPILGVAGFDNTARKRMFAFMLTGRDDKGTVAVDRQDITNARRNAQLDLISDLLSPLEVRLQSTVEDDPDASIERVENAISQSTIEVTGIKELSEEIKLRRQNGYEISQRAYSQVTAIDELLIRYDLLDKRYESDLKRLDFISEGAHYFDELQEVNCPLCDEIMSPTHVHIAEGRSVSIYDSARFEAAKILGQRKDLGIAVKSLNDRREIWSTEKLRADQIFKRAEEDIRNVLSPAIRNSEARLESLITRRVQLEAIRSERDQIDSLRQLKEAIERTSQRSGASAREWEKLPASALRIFCTEIEKVLKEWGWKDTVRVEFDEQKYDIIVDGQARQSHGKGVRAILHSAFAISLLRYCKLAGRPHIGTVIIDSPLTSYKKGKSSASKDGPVDAGIENGFWNSLVNIDRQLQIVIIENKEPPDVVAAAVPYLWFAGETAQSGERAGFAP